MTNPCPPHYHLSSLLFGADLGFHAEWLRDEPYEATTTGSELIFWSPGVNSRPTKGEHEIRGAEFLSISFLFSSYPGKEDFAFQGTFSDGSSRRLLRSEWLNDLGNANVTYELRCRECGKSWGNQPRSICDDCFSPLEVFYDYEAARPTFTRERIAQGPASMWRYRDLLPLPANYQPTVPAGFTPLLEAPRLAQKLGAKRLYLKNDAVCQPSLSFKDRVVAVALAQARSFGFDTVSCSSTGNLANSVAAQAARNGFKAVIFIPADLEPAKILGTQVFGAKLVRILGSYDQVNRLCSQIADEHHWGFVNVNLRPYYAEGSKTVGFEIAEQLGWRLPDNVVCPMAGGSLIIKIKKAFEELVHLGLVEAKPVKYFGAQAPAARRFRPR